MENKTVMRYHFVHIRSKTILNSYNIKQVWKYTLYAWCSVNAEDQFEEHFEKL